MADGGVFIKAEENEVTKQVLPGMIFLPLFILVTVLFIVGRTTYQAIHERRKRPLNSQEVADQVNDV